MARRVFKPDSLSHSGNTGVPALRFSTVGPLCLSAPSRSYTGGLIKNSLTKSAPYPMFALVGE